MESDSAPQRERQEAMEPNRNPRGLSNADSYCDPGLGLVRLLFLGLASECTQVSCQ